MSKSLTIASPISRGARFFMVVTLVLGISFAGAPAQAVLVAPLIPVAATSAVSLYSAGGTLFLNTVAVGIAVCSSSVNACGPVKQAALALLNDAAELLFTRERNANSDLDSLGMTATGYEIYSIGWASTSNQTGFDIYFTRSPETNVTCGQHSARVRNINGISASPVPTAVGNLCRITNTSTAFNVNAPVAGVVIANISTINFDTLRTTDVLRWGDAILTNEFGTDPNRRLVAHGLCINAQGGYAPASTAYSSIYTDTGSLPALPVPVCPEDYGLVEVDVYEEVQSLSTSTWFRQDLIWQAKFNPTFQNTYKEQISTNTQPSPDPDNGADACTWGGTSTTCTPGFDIEPSTNTGTNTVTVEAPVNTGPGTVNSADPTGEGCAPSGWQWLNPAAYVRSTVCIFQWAFVPPNTTQTTAQLQAAINGTGVGTITTVFTMLMQPIQDIDTTSPFDCNGPAVTLPTAYSNVSEDMTVYPFRACTEPAVTIATLARTIQTFTLYVGTGLASIHVIAGAFGIRLRGDA